MPQSDQLDAIADELAVRKVLDEYCLRLEVNTFEEWMDLFTDDTVYEVFKRELRGREQVSAMLSQAPKGVHLGGPVRVELQGDRAETVQNYLFIGSDSDSGTWGGTTGHWSRWGVRGRFRTRRSPSAERAPWSPENLIRTARSLESPGVDSQLDCQSLAVSSGWAS